MKLCKVNTWMCHVEGADAWLQGLRNEHIDFPKDPQKLALQTLRSLGK